MTLEQAEWQLVHDAQASIGEVPIWVPEQHSLFWVDIDGPSLNRTDVRTGDTTSWEAPDTIGCYGLTPDLGSAVIATLSGIHRLDLSSGRVETLIDAPYDRTHYRFNDGRCDPRGRFWIGTIRLPDSDEPDGGASFWRLDNRGLSRQIENLTIANGIAYSPDGTTMYLADRPNWQILAFDYDPETGTPSRRRTFVRVPEGDIPDGAAVDTDGGYWIAFFKAGRIARYLPDGTLDRELAAPTAHPTMVAFGGEDLQTLYVTTARRFLDDEQLRAEPLAGGIFSCDVGVRGLPEPRLAAGI